VQTVSLRGAKLMQIKKDIYVAAPNHIWRLLPVPILAQVRTLPHLTARAGRGRAVLAVLVVGRCPRS
jgi:hypothetical protein